MKYSSILLFTLISASALASDVIQVQDLNSALASRLGFEVSISENNKALLVSLDGPNLSSSGCPAKRSGNALLTSDGDEIMVYVTELSDSNSLPKATGYITNQSYTLSIWIDYICPAGQELESIRYVVPSINEWLITSR